MRLSRPGGSFGPGRPLVFCFVAIVIFIRFVDLWHNYRTVGHHCRGSYGVATKNKHSRHKRSTLPEAGFNIQLFTYMGIDDAKPNKHMQVLGQAVQEVFESCVLAHGYKPFMYCSHTESKPLHASASEHGCSHEFAKIGVTIQKFAPLTSDAAKAL